MPIDSTRLSLLELRMKTVEDSHQEIKLEVKSINKTIWTAAGAVGALVGLIELFMKGLK